MSSSSFLIVCVFSRFSGCFLFSPLLQAKIFPFLLKLGLCILFTLLLLPQLESFSFPLSSIKLLMTLQIVKEICVGFLLGFFLKILFEGALLAGQMIGTLAGFSALEYLDPLSLSSSPLLGKAFAFIAALVFLAMDLHHAFIKLFYRSFYVFPFQSYPFTENVIGQLEQATSSIFTTAFEYGAFGFTVLTIFLLIMALGSRLLPRFPLFWMAFPLQILLGIGCIFVSIALFPEITKHSFLYIKTFIKSFLSSQHVS